MAETLEELVLKLSADVSGLSAGFSHAVEESKKTSEKIEGHLEKIKGGFEGLMKVVELAAVAIGVELGIHAFKELIFGSIEAVDAMAKLSDKTNIAIESLYGMKILCDDTGVSFESLTGSITKMEKILAVATRGTNAASSALEELGLSAEELKKKSPEDAFFEIADALNKVGDHAEKTRLSMVLLGRGGAELANVIRAGSKGFEEARKTAEELGYSLSRIDAEKVALAKNQMELVNAALHSVGQTLAVELAPYIGEFAKQIVDTAKKTHGLKDVVIDVVEAIVKGFKYANDIVYGFKIEWAAVKVAFLTFVDGFWHGIDMIVSGIVHVVEFIKNLIHAIDESRNLIGSGFALTAAAIRKVFTDIFFDILGVMDKFLSSTAIALQKVAPATAAQFTSAAEAIGRNFGTMKVDANNNFNEVSKAAGEQAIKTKNAWVGIFDMPKVDEAHKIVGALGLDNADQLLKEAKQDLTDLVNTPPPGQGILDWLNQVKEKAEAAATAALSIGKPGGEGGDGEDPVLKYQDELKEKLKALDLYQNEDLSKESDWFTAQSELLKAAKEQGLITESEYQLALEDLNIKHTARLNAIDADGARKNLAIWQSGWMGKATIVSNVLGSLSVLMQTKNREMFEVGKAAAYASTIINTASAAMGAYNAYASIPYVGPVLGAAAAAAAIAAGAIQLSTISSTTFGGGGSVGGSFSTSPPSAGSTPGGLVQGDGSSSGNQVGSRQTTEAPTDITINVPDHGMSKEALMNLAEELDNLKKDGVTFGKLKFQ